MKGKMMPYLVGAVTGVLNGLFGAGGGMVAVPMLSKAGLDTQQAHATSIAIILPLTIISSCIYLFQGHLALGDAFVYLPGGVAGALLGSLLLKKLNPIWVRRIFGGLILFSAVRLLLR